MVLGLLSFTFLGNKQVGEGVNRGGEWLNRVGYDGKGSLIKNYKKKHEVYHLFLRLIQVIHLYIAQIRISLNSLRAIMFQDLKASNLQRVSNKHLT